MFLTRHDIAGGPAWALDGRLLPGDFSLGHFLSLPSSEALAALAQLATSEPASGALLAPIEPMHEVWASGVTYLRSRDARKAESTVADVYQLVYEAERPELFLKSIGWRVVGPDAAVRVRRDSSWDVPEPELTLVINSRLEIVGYCAGNDVSSRSIEGENPLYLPQAKVYADSCALGPGIVLAAADALRDVPIKVAIDRANETLFEGETSTARMRRTLEDLVAYLGKAMAFPYGAFLMTGTGIVPPDSFTLQAGDQVRVTVGELLLSNSVLEA